jgi:Fur family ferric uptake transcriptional regulator
MHRGYRVGIETRSHVRATAEGAPSAQSIDERVEQVLELLRANGGRVTTSRRLLVQSLLTTAGHRTAEDLAAEVQTAAPDVHLSTIYRNLDELERLGVIVHAHLGHGPSIYHLAAESHGHFVCEECGTTLEATREVFADLAETARRHFGFEIDPRHFAVLGLCAACQSAAGRSDHDPAPHRDPAPQHDAAGKESRRFEP